MSVFIYEKDDDGIVTVTMDMTGPVNAVNAEYNVAMEETVSRLEVEDDLSGVIFASAKKVFFAGADLKELVLADSNDVQGLFAEGESFKSQLRRLEKLPVQWLPLLMAPRWVAVMSYLWPVIIDLPITTNLSR